MTRVLIILAAVAALALSAAPLASAGPASAARFELSSDGHSMGFFAEMDSAVAPTVIVLKHGQGTAALSSWARSGTRKNATLELHAADGTTVARYHLENSWVAKVETGGLYETVTIGSAEIERDI